MNESRVAANELTREILDYEDLLTALGLEKPYVIRDTTA